MAASFQESEIREKNGKGPATNVLGIALVLVPRAQKEWIVNKEEP